MNPEAPLRGVGAAILCPVCQGPFAPARPKQCYCTKRCRDTAYRRRNQSVAKVTVPASRPRRSQSIYECSGCGIRTVGIQRCEECNLYMARVDFGGSCPHCEEPVAVSDLMGKEAIPGIAVTRKFR